MNKKFLSAILFGALMVTSTGTFVSCKDYDDDITNLQEQVDVQKSDLASKVSALESSISSLQSAQSSLDSKIAAAKDAAAKAAADAQAAATAAAADAAAKAQAAATAAAELAAAEAQAAAIAAAQEELAAAKAELVAAIAAAGAEHAADVEELQAALAAAATKHGADIAALNAAIEAAVAGQAADLKALEDAHAAEVLALQSAIATLTANHAADVEGLEAAIAEATEAANVKMAELSGAIQTLEAFAVTTEEALEDLTAADKALETSIAALDAKIAEQAVLVGKNTTAIAAQAEALENYKKAMEEYQLANDAAAKAAIAKVEGTLAAMKAAADAQAKALNDYIAANNAAVAGNAASIKTNAEAIETLAADIKALQEGQLTEAKVNEIAAQVTKELEGKLDLMSAIYNKMITSVSLVKVLGEDDFTNLALVSSKAVRTWTFGEGMPGAIEFNKGAKETFEQSFVIRVSPSNATVDESTLQLVNSQMGNLDELVDIVSIKPYTGLISSRGVSANGLWEVTVKLNEEYDADAYAEASQVKVNGELEDIVYAVMVGDEDRKVISEYGITLGDQDYHALRTLDFNVDATNVSKIHNRWYGVGSNGPLAKPEMSDDKVPFLEKTWNMTQDINDKYIYSPWDVPTYEDNPNTSKNEINVINDENDKRNLLSAYSVKAGKAFTVNFTDIKEKKDGKVYEFTDHIRGFYVTLDEECAVESHPSEIRAWEAYDVEGLNEVSTTGSIELTIPEEAGAEGDYIGFRVFAVNYDGSLVDPDGKAFYVYVGETDKGVAELTLSISDKVIVGLQTTTVSTTDDFSTAKWGRAQGGKYDLVIKEADGTPVYDNNAPSLYSFGVNWNNFKFTYVDGNGNTQTVALFADGSNLINNAVITKITTVEMINVPASSLKDGMTYTATITAKNTNSGNVAIATVKFAKQLPGFPAYMQPFTGQLVSNNLMVFPYYDAITGKALYDMTSSWHGLKNAQETNADTRWGVTAENFYHAVSSNQQFSYDNQTNILSANKSHLNPAASTYLTKWPTNLSYNYGLIRYNSVDEVWAVRNHITYYGDFTMQFGNYVNECKYSMDTNLKIVYPGAIGKTSKFELSKVVIKDWYNAAVSLLKIKEQTPGSKEAKFFAKDFKVEFLTGANFDIVNEYYTFDKIKNEPYTDADGNEHDNWLIYMTSNSDAATGNPVVTKVRLTFKDKFGNEIVKVVDGSFTMTYQE